ncbi:MAG: hypothetical protein F6K47_19825 [Symploca sp. SIO2E6]|nr:hypothetical protein [Symploca sp. SIO2E6]
MGSKNCGDLIGKAQKMIPDLDEEASKIAKQIIEATNELQKRIDNGLKPKTAERELKKLRKRLERLADEELGAVSKVITESPTGPTKHPSGTEFKKPKEGLSGKEGATDIPGWVKDEGYGFPLAGESGRDFATRVLNGKYGYGNWGTGPGTEFNKIKKWADRHFE